MKCRKKVVLQRLEDAFRAALPKIKQEVKNFPIDGCFVSCVLTLKNFIGAEGWDAILRCGTFGESGHYWIELSDKTIVDPSFGQFHYWEGIRVIEPSDVLYKKYRYS